MLRGLFALSLMAVLLFVAAWSPQSASNEIDPKVVSALIVRVNHDLAAAEAKNRASLIALEKEEKKSAEHFAEKSLFRREAEEAVALKIAAERRAQAQVDRGQATTANVNSASNQREAAERALQRAADQERMARARLEEKRRELEAVRKRQEERRAISQEMSRLQQEFQMTPTLDKGEEIEDKVMQVAAANGINSTVTWQTQRVIQDSPKPVASPGAIVYYQTKRGRKRGDPERSLNNPTDCVQALPIGSYYIWSVRHGKDTSDRNRPPVTFIAPSESATILEDIQ